MKFKGVLQAAAICFVITVLGSGTSYAQTTCTSISVSPGSAGFFNSGGFGTFFVTASPSGCSFSISTVSAPFVVITSSNFGTVDYLVASNPGNARSGFVDVTSGFVRAEFFVDQQAAPPPPEPAAPVIDMFRYYNPNFKHHFYTTNFGELGYGGSQGWNYEAIKFHVLSSLQPNSVPLYRYYASSTHDHFYTTDFSELGNGAQGYVLEEIQCYVYPTQQSGTTPLYRYRNVNTGEHFYTTDINEVGGNGNYVLEKIQAYVLS
jgi:hypothetical protein